jgi:tetratricopeptide (TPR) repeat protein
VRLRTRSLALALVSLLVCSTAQARARPRSGAAQAFLRGKRLFDRGDFTAAVAAFEEAYRLKPHHAVQCSIALCYEQMNRFVEAAEHYRRCLAGGAAKTGKAREVRRSLAGVEARINWVNVQSPAPGGTVHVDGVALGPAPRRVPLNPGRHMLEVRRHGAWPATIVLQLLSGEERTVTLAPAAKDERPAPASAPTVAVRETPREPPADKPDRPSRRRLSPAWFWTSAALTVALAGAAATMGGLTYKAHEDYYDRPTREGYDTFVQRRLVTNILAGLAVAAGATGTVLFFYTDFSGRRNEQVSAGIGLRGTF